MRRVRPANFSGSGRWRRAAGRTARVPPAPPAAAVTWWATRAPRPGPAAARRQRPRGASRPDLASRRPWRQPGLQLKPSSARMASAAGRFVPRCQSAHAPRPAPRGAGAARGIAPGDHRQGDAGLLQQLQAVAIQGVEALEGLAGLEKYRPPSVSTPSTSKRPARAHPWARSSSCWGAKTGGGRSGGRGLFIRSPWRASGRRYAPRPPAHRWLGDQHAGDGMLLHELRGVGRQRIDGWCAGWHVMMSWARGRAGPAPASMRRRRSPSVKMPMHRPASSTTAAAPMPLALISRISVLKSTCGATAAPDRRCASRRSHGSAGGAQRTAGVRAGKVFRTKATRVQQGPRPARRPWPAAPWCWWSGPGSAGRPRAPRCSPAPGRHGAPATTAARRHGDQGHALAFEHGQQHGDFLLSPLLDRPATGRQA